MKTNQPSLAPLMAGILTLGWWATVHAQPEITDVVDCATRQVVSHDGGRTWLDNPAPSSATARGGASFGGGYNPQMQIMQMAAGSIGQAAGQAIGQGLANMFFGQPGPSAAEQQAAYERQLAEQRWQAEEAQRLAEAARRARLVAAARIRADWDGRDQAMSDQLGGAFDVLRPRGTAFFGLGGDAAAGAANPDDAGAASPESDPNTPIVVPGVPTVAPTMVAPSDTSVVNLDFDENSPGSLRFLEAQRLRAEATAAFAESQSAWRTDLSPREGDPRSPQSLYGDSRLDYLVNTSELGRSVMRGLSEAPAAAAFGASQRKLQELESLAQTQGSAYGRKLAESLVFDVAVARLISAANAWGATAEPLGAGYTPPRPAAAPLPEIQLRGWSRNPAFIPKYTEIEMAYTGPDNRVAIEAWKMEWRAKGWTVGEEITYTSKIGGAEFRPYASRSLVYYDK